MSFCNKLLYIAVLFRQPDLLHTVVGKKEENPWLNHRFMNDLAARITFARSPLHFFDTHAGNPAIAARYVDSDRDKVIQLVFEFLCMATGGSEEYTGRDMLTVHRGMNISEQEFMAVLDDILLALQANGVGQREQEELLLANYNLRGDIVRV